MNYRFLTTIMATAMAALPLVSAADDTMVTKNLNTYFLYAGLNTRIDSIEVSKTHVDSPALKDMGENGDEPGFVVIHMTVQNPSGSEDRSIPGNVWGWETADGAQRDMSAADHEYAGASYVDEPSSLHPKQTIKLAYVFSWNGQPLTKLFLKRNSGDGSNDSGAQYVRFELKPDDLKPLQ